MLKGKDCEKLIYELSECFLQDPYRRRNPGAFQLLDTHDVLDKTGEANAMATAAYLAGLLQDADKETPVTTSDGQ